MKSVSPLTDASKSKKSHQIKDELAGKKGLPPKSPIPANPKKPPAPPKPQVAATPIKSEASEMKPLETPVSKKGERNQAVLDFLAYEDSDDDLERLVKA